MVPVTLSAHSVGYLAAARPPQVLRVHSRFARALNLQSEDGSLLTLLCADQYPNLPDAVRVALPEKWNWRHEAEGPMPVRLVDGVLHSVRFRVDLRAATEWRPGLRDGALPQPSFALLEKHAQTLTSQQHRFCLEHQVESALQWQPAATLPGLIPAETPEQLEQQVDRLIGYGKGLTPDGDDYLLGYLAALWPWRLAAPLAGHRRRLQQKIARHLHQTTDISRHYLNRALQGHFSQPICDLLEQLSMDAPPATMIAHAEQVMSFGATSGVDCLAGVLHGMRNLNVDF